MITVKPVLQSASSALVCKPVTALLLGTAALVINLT